MDKRYGSWMLIILLLASTAVWAQDSTTQQPPDSSQQQATPDNGQQPAAPPPAFGQEPTPPQGAQFPPLSGLDEASLEPNLAPRSFLLLGFRASEVADSNVGNRLKTGAHSFTGVTHLTGSMALQRLWRRYQVGLDYVGGGALYSASSRRDSQLHQLSFDSRMLWRTGVFQIRDSFSYLPEGSFGGSFGGVGSFGTGLGGLGGGELGGTGGGGQFNFFGSGQAGTLGIAPRINNLAIMDLQQSISPRSSFTLAGGYALAHFMHSNISVVNSRQVSAQAGYNYALNRRNQIALAYGFQQFSFPNAGSGTLDGHTLQLLYGHQISGRLDLVVGGGPQYLHLSDPLRGSASRLTATGRASLRYRFPKTTVSLSYSRLQSGGSGFFTGATADQARLMARRPMGRKWDLSASVGYKHDRRLQTSTAGINARSDRFGYAGTQLGRLLTRNLNTFVMYQFNYLNFDHSFCTTAPCSRTSIRHVVGIGLRWHPNPIRLD